MKQAGSTGFATVSSQELRGASKGRQGLRRSCRGFGGQMTRDAGIHILANFIFGLPDDDLESMRATLDLAMRINAEWTNFYCAMAYPGSELYDVAIKEGWPSRKSGRDIRNTHMRRYHCPRDVLLHRTCCASGITRFKRIIAIRNTWRGLLGSSARGCRSRPGDGFAQAGEKIRVKSRQNTSSPLRGEGKLLKQKNYFLIVLYLFGNPQSFSNLIGWNFLDHTAL